MRAEMQIQALYDTYPTLYQTRDEVLNFLFMVGGNGFEWVNGELVEKGDPTAKVKNKLKNKKGFQYTKTNEFDRALLRDRPRKARWHLELGSGHFLCHYPSNIKKDWLKLLNECKEMIIEDGLEPPVASERDIELYGVIYKEGGGPLYAPGG